MNNKGLNIKDEKIVLNKGTCFICNINDLLFLRGAERTFEANLKHLIKYEHLKYLVYFALVNYAK